MALCWKCREFYIKRFGPNYWLSPSNHCHHDLPEEAPSVCKLKRPEIECIDFEMENKLCENCKWEKEGMFCLQGHVRRIKYEELRAIGHLNIENCHAWGEKKGEICPFFEYPDCKIGADVCIGDEWEPEKCDVYVEALASYARKEEK